MIHFKSLLAACALMALAVAAQAADTGLDYYQPGTAEAVKSVNKNHYEKGILQLQSGRLEYAYNEFAFILRRIVNHPQALAAMAATCVRMGRTDRAYQFFDTALRSYPQYAATHVVYAIFLHKQGQMDKAIGEYKAALEREPNHPDAHYNLGLAYFVKKNYTAANAEAQKAYALGYPLPGLRDKLKSVHAWAPQAEKTAEPKGAAGKAPSETDKEEKDTPAAETPAHAEPAQSDR